MDTSEFSDEQIEALQALADGYNDQSVSRRDVMKLVGAGGVGALLGGGGMASAVGQASAGTAQSGQLGAVGDPLDLVTEDVMDQSGNVVASANAGALEGTELQYESVTTDRVDMGVSGHGPIGSKQEADVKLYYGVKTDIRSDFYVRAVDKNGVIDEYVGDVVGSATNVTAVVRSGLDAAYNPSVPDRSGTVKVVSNSDQILNLGNPDTTSDPILTVKENVTVDMTGVGMGFGADASAAFEMRSGATINAPGAFFTMSSSGTGPSAGWYLPENSSSTSSSVEVLGYPLYGSAPTGHFAFDIEQTSGGSVADALLTVAARNGRGLVTIESTGSGGFVNDNNIIAKGSYQGAVSRGSSSNTTVIDFHGTNNINFNQVLFRDGQSKSPDHLARIERGNQNIIGGTVADNGNSTTSTYYIGSSVGGPQALSHFYGGTSVTNNSGIAMCFTHPIRKEFGQNLTVLSGDVNMTAYHDGSGTPPKGLAIWDDTLASGAGNWRSQVDGSTFGPN